MAQQPILQCSPVDARVYIVTSYRIDLLADDRGTVITPRRQYDITTGFERLVKDRARFKRLIKKRTRKGRT
jgi:hypothetical protein